MTIWQSVYRERRWQTAWPTGDLALFSNSKIREVLGFREEHNWRNYVDG